MFSEVLSISVFIQLPKLFRGHWEDLHSPSRTSICHIILNPFNLSKSSSCGSVAANFIGLHYILRIYTITYDVNKFAVKYCFMWRVSLLQELLCGDTAVSWCCLLLCSLVGGGVGTYTFAPAVPDAKHESLIKTQSPVLWELVSN